jgi:hypothetical protein
MVDNLRIQYSYFVDEGNPEYKAPYNHLFNIPRVFTPDDKAIQTPNSDTPYSWVGLDLRVSVGLRLVREVHACRDRAFVLASGRTPYDALAHS